jgi:hypothetical protein
VTGDGDITKHPSRPDKPNSPTPSDFDWGSPRWRESDREQGHVERDRRLRATRAPRQRGAIDQGGVDPSSEAPDEGVEKSDKPDGRPAAEAEEETAER